MLRYKILATGIITAIGLILIIAFGRQTFHIPLLGYHCIKTAKSIEVAYNLVRYKDFTREYNDWQATPSNPRGARGRIFTYESPLSALTLGGLYLIFDGSDFDTRVAIARVFTLLHLICAYLILAVLIFRKSPFALGIFTFLFVGSAFTVSYSTKPLPEVYAVMYQVVILVGGTYLLSTKISEIKKAVILAGLSALLCIGGKMNYFLLALPIVVGYVFFDRNIWGVKNKLKYFTVFAVLGIVGALTLVFFAKLDLYKSFVFLIKGNKPIINNSLWDTFIEGFDALDDIIKRTREDFGILLFDWGKKSFLYLSLKAAYLLIFARKRSLELFERFSVMLFMLFLGHILNYVVLRNLFIPHRYYVVPMFIVFCLSLTIFLSDVRGMLFEDMLFKRKIKEFIFQQIPILSKTAADINLFISKHRFILSSVSVLLVAALVTNYFASDMGDLSARENLISALKILGAQSLAIEISSQIDFMYKFTKAISLIFTITAIVFGLVYFVFFFFHSSKSPFVFLQSLSKRLFVSPVYIFFMGLLLIPAGDIVLNNALLFYEYHSYHFPMMEDETDLAVIRKDTVSGDLVLCRKPCNAFYADKRSIENPKHEDLKYYQDNNVHSIMRPKKPFRRYYKKIEEYTNRITYWEPRKEINRFGGKLSKIEDKNENP